MDKAEAVRKLLDLKDVVETMPFTKGKSRLVRTITSFIDRLSIYKGGGDIGAHFVKECESEFEKIFGGPVHGARAN